MNDEQLLRYSRQIMLPEIDAAGQQRIIDSRVLIIGAGGLGSPVAMYLAAAGVGQIVISDDDQVELTNLQRQILFRTDDIGRNKVEAAQETLNRLNPEIKVIPMPLRLEGQALEKQVKLADVVVDGSDNFPTRFAINEACVKLRTPLVSGAAIRMEGQLTVYRLDQDDSPCYRCLYEPDGPTEQTCSESGVFTPLVGIIGSLQAAETLKVLLDMEGTLAGRLMLFDLKQAAWREMKLKRDPKCPVCGA